MKIEKQTRRGTRITVSLTTFVANTLELINQINNACSVHTAVVVFTSLISASNSVFTFHSQSLFLFVCFFSLYSLLSLLFSLLSICSLSTRFRHTIASYAISWKSLFALTFKIIDAIKIKTIEFVNTRSIQIAVVIPHSSFSGYQF